MKKIIAFSLSLSILFSNVTQAQTESPFPPIVITEIAAYPPSDEEWIEIFNRTNDAIDLTGWKFFEDDTNHRLEILQGDFVLEPQEFAIIANKEEKIKELFPLFEGTIFDSSWVNLAEDGEFIGLKGSDGELKEFFQYLPMENTSLERRDAESLDYTGQNWQRHATGNSFGVKNSEPQISVSTPETTIPQKFVEAALEESKENHPPIAKLKANIQDLTLDVDGSESHDPDQDELQFSWDFGDGIKSIEKNPTPHGYAEPGIYTVTLGVTDPSGAESRAEVTFQGQTKLECKEISAAAGGSSSNLVQKSTNLKKQPKKNSTLITQDSSNEKKRAREPRSQRRPREPKGRGDGIRRSEATEVPFQGGTVGSPHIKNQISEYANGDISRAIMITEVLPNPEGDEGEEEWIELFNASGKKVWLGNWKLDDSEKGSKPYSIPDTLAIEPWSYGVFRRNETRLALNNTKDVVRLFDFRDTLVSSISYEKTKEGWSYALIEVEEDLGAGVARGAMNEHQWQWTNDVTEGQKNPTYRRLRGKMKEFLSSQQAFSLELNGKVAEVRFGKEVLHPLMAGLGLPVGTELLLEAKPLTEGIYELKSIETVTPPKESDDEIRGNAPPGDAILLIIVVLLIFVMFLHFRSTSSGLVGSSEGTARARTSGSCGLPRSEPIK